MKSFKQYITEAKKDLPKGNPAGMTPGDIEGFKSATPGQRPKNLSTDYDTSSRRTRSRIYRTGRTVRKRGSVTPASTPKPPVKPPSTVDQTDVNKFIRGEAEKGRAVSQPLADTAGVRDAARRGEIKPVQAGGSKSTAPQGRISRVRLKGDLAASGVDTSPAPSRLNPRGRRLGDTTKGGPVKTFRQPAPTISKPSPAPKPAPAPKPPVVTKSPSAATRMSAAVEKIRVADKELADKANEILKQTRAKTPPTVKATPTPTSAPKPTAAPKPKAVELPKFTKPAPTRVAPPPQTLNKFLRPRPVADVKPKAMPSPAAATQTPAPKPKFRTTTPKSTIPSDVPANVAKQFVDAGYDKPGSSTAAEKARITKKIKDLTPSQSATNRAVNRAVKQAIRKPQVRAIRGASTALKGLGVAGTALDARSEYLYRKNELGQSASTATAGSAARTGGGLAGGRFGAMKGAQLGGKFGPKGALIGGAIGGIAGYLGGSSLGTKAFDAVQSPKSAAKSYKQFIKGLAGNK